MNPNLFHDWRILIWGALVWLVIWIPIYLFMWK